MVCPHLSSLAINTGLVFFQLGLGPERDLKNATHRAGGRRPKYPHFISFLKDSNVRRGVLGLLWIFELLNCGLNFVRCTVHQVTKIGYSHSPRHGEVEQQKRLNVKLQADRLTACLDGWKCHRIQGTPKSLKMFASLNRYTKYTMKIQRSCTAMATKIDFGEQHPKGLHWNLVAMDPSFWTHDTSTMLKT